MNSNNYHSLSLFFALLFITIVAAPTLVMSINDNVDITIFYGENDEEEKENLKLLFEKESIDSENQPMIESEKKNDGYTFKTYPNPHFNLIFPPPDLI